MSLFKIVPSARTLALASGSTKAAHQLAAVPIRPHSRAGMPSQIAVVGNYLPQQGGIAAFTIDLCESISTEYGSR